nr:PD40 domain-containing protein [Acidobacteriota bacterium]
LSHTAPIELAQTAGGTQPFWSPDGTQIAFFADGKLKKIDLQGSPPQAICDAPSPRGGAWGPDGKIVFSGSFRTGLEIVDAAGGAPSPLTKLDEARHEKSHRWPVFLPGGGHLLFVAQTSEAGAKDDASTIEALSMSTGARTRLIAANSSPLYSPEGYLLFWREGALRGIRFDARTLAVSGNVFPVASAVGLDANELAYATVSADGTLVFLPGTIAMRSTLGIVDRAGRRVGTVAESVLVEGGLDLSHDGTRLAVGITAAGARDTDIWIYDLARGTSGPLTFEEGGDRYPVWSTGDTHVLYANDGRNDGVLYRRSADGRGTLEQVASTASGLWSYGLSRDGTWLVAGIVTGPTSFDLMRYDIGSGKTTPLVQSPFDDVEGALSPDEKWLAYSSDHTGRREVYVRSLDGDTGRWQISTQGGGAPAWRADGRELYFVTAQGQLMAVDVQAAGAFRHSPPRMLFEAIFNNGEAYDNGRFYAPMPDGQRFVVATLKERTTSLLTLVTNWTTGAGK